MSIQNRALQRRIRRAGPWARLAAIWTASLIALTGLWLELEPAEILWRSSVGAAIIGTLAGLGISVVEAANGTRR